MALPAPHPLSAGEVADHFAALREHVNALRAQARMLAHSPNFSARETARAAEKEAALIAHGLALYARRLRALEHPIATARNWDRRYQQVNGGCAPP